jgi:hypothetical protein
VTSFILQHYICRRCASQTTPFFKRFLVLKITRRKFLGSAVAAGVCSRLAIAQEEKLRIGVTDWNLKLKSGFHAR